MIERLENIATRYEEINELLMDQQIISNIRKTMELSKEQALLKESYNAFLEYKKILTAIEETKEMTHDLEFGEMAKEELEILYANKEKLEKEIELLLLPKDPNDGKDVIMEIRGAAGGDEANIFAGNLYRMYSKYAETQDWTVEVITLEQSEAGGFSRIEMIIKGDNVYSKLKYESGAHRVQRVPETETQGRVHTSTATVLVMPEADEVDVEIRSEDLKVDVYRSSGAGGQHVNTTDSAVRITHIPTGTVVACQNERSQIKNRERAMQMLRAKVYEEQIRKQEEAVGAERRNKVGTGDRSEKIRTYNFPQNRLTDHRIGFTLKQLDRVMDGDLEEVLQALITEDQARKLRGE
jgi:peptide chain release factor 1